jgi:Uncharacterized protein conserved in bacteria
MKITHSYIGISAIVLSSLLTACGDKTSQQGATKTVEWKEQKIDHVKVTYTALNIKAKGAIDSFKKAYTEAQQKTILSINRVDSKNLHRLDTLLVPSDVDAEWMRYSVFPYNIPSLKEVKKIVFFSYPAQAFGAYEYGKLVYWGPTSMGRKDMPTPTKLYYANWKAEETQSTVDDEWILKWNFNIENKEGIGWHEYEMPGYPASHSCLRMLEADAKYMYEWAEQWIQKDEQTVAAKGTPAIVFGSYPFDGPKPWYALLQNPDALDISVKTLEDQALPHLEEILNEQRNREAVAAKQEKK